jgi:molybdopterin/thiamine biosynthesis adenylyltransferase
MGCIEALEALKFLTGMPVLLKNRLLVWEGDLAKFEEIRIERDPSCPVCSKT